MKNEYIFFGHNNGKSFQFIQFIFCKSYFHVSEFFFHFLFNEYNHRIDDDDDFGFFFAEKNFISTIDNHTYTIGIFNIKSRESLKRIE